jgi:hypothetical protein
MIRSNLIVTVKKQQLDAARKCTNLHNFFDVLYPLLAHAGRGLRPVCACTKMKGLLRAGDGGKPPQTGGREGAEYAISRFLRHCERSFWMRMPGV